MDDGGTANFADYQYTPTRPERRPFMGNDGRYSPWDDLRWFKEEDNRDVVGDLKRLEDEFREFPHLYAYALGFAALVFLDETGQGHGVGM